MSFNVSFEAHAAEEDEDGRRYGVGAHEPVEIDRPRARNPELNAVHQYPYIYDADLAAQPVVRPGGRMGEYVDPDAPFGPEYVRQQIERENRKTQHPLYCFLSVVAGMSKTNINTMFQTPQDSLVHSLSAPPPPLSAPFSAEGARGDRQERLEMVEEALLRNPSLAGVVGLTTNPNNPLQFAFMSEWAQSGFQPLTGETTACLLKARQQLRAWEAERRGDAWLGEGDESAFELDRLIIRHGNEQVYTQFASLCACMLVSFRANALTRPVSRQDEVRLARMFSQCKDFFMRVHWDDTRYRVQPREVKRQSIMDMYEKL